MGKTQNQANKSTALYVPTTDGVTILVSDAGKKYSLIPSMFRNGGFKPCEMERMRPRWI
jgi:hypothetical protein